ncbi:hypothetical protein MTO96_012508 [Rhipicephalus appendiculatus]
MDSLQETLSSPRKQLQIPTDKSGTEATQMDVQILSPQDSSEEADSGSVPECSDGRTWTDDGSQTASTRRQKSPTSRRTRQRLRTATPCEPANQSREVR